LIRHFQSETEESLDSGADVKVNAAEFLDLARNDGG
jgi:hypothetical protein